ncbi:MAG TPA: class I SAM-dependent methyltransferase [Bryobacteraceae bacterium]|nr:class I SAM-dependent methyltransferase [Bryobacteraceae bacterium]
MTALLAQAAYRILAQDYDTQPNALLNLEERTLGPLLDDLRGQRVVDAAAGTGRWARYCEQRGARAVSVDSCREMLNHTESLAVVADVNRLPLKDGCADATICAFALGYAPACLAELCRITRRGGVVFASDVHPDAIRRGWTRTFRSGGELVEVAHHPYSLKDLRVPGLELTLLLEPCLGPPEREIFAKLGRLHRFDEAARGPAIFVARWVRT